MALASLLEDTVVIREIAVGRPLFSYELGREGSNLEAIRRNVDSFAGSGREGPQGEAPARKLLIENLHVRDGRIAASAVFLEGRSWEVPLPDLRLRNLSSGEAGVAAAGIVETVTTEVARNARESVAPIRELAGELGERIAGGASKVVEGITRKIEKAPRVRAGDLGAGLRIRPRDPEEEGGKPRARPWRREPSRQERHWMRERSPPAKPSRRERSRPARALEKGNRQGHEDAGQAPREGERSRPPTGRDGRRSGRNRFAAALVSCPSSNVGWSS